MSDTSGCPVRPQVSSVANPVHKPASLPTNKGSVLGKQWVPPTKEASASASLGTLGGEPGSAFAKYVRKDKTLERKNSGGHSDEAPQLGTNKSGSDEPETTCEQPSTSAKMQNQQPATTLESKDEKIAEGDEENAEECSNSSSQSSADSEGTNSKHSSKKRCRSDTSSQSKKQRLIWTPELHARFLAAVNHLGVKNAVPKTILQLMNVEGMTRENVASHLQKYRLYLKRLAGLPPNIPLSAETMHQVQSVQAALHQQVQVGLQTNQALQLAATGGAVPLTSLATLPVQAPGLGGYHDLLGQLAGCTYAGGMAGMAGATPLQQFSTPQMLYPTGADGSLSGLSRGGLEGAVGFIPGGLIPINLCQLAVPGLAGLQPAATLLGTHPAPGLGVVSPLTLTHAAAPMRQGGEPSLGLQPARNGN